MGVFKRTLIFIKMKTANNILELLLDPTVFPIKQRVYFGPGENLRNESYDKAKEEALALYGNQSQNTDFYCNRKQLSRRAHSMDRKTLIASMDILSQQFKEDDPIAKDLRTMAYAVSKLSDDDLQTRLSAEEVKPEEVKPEEVKPEEAKPEEGKTVEAAKTFKCPTCGTKVLEQTKYCVKCKKKVKPPKTASVSDWTKEASEAVMRALIAEVKEDKPEEVKPEEVKPEEKEAGKVPGIPDGTGPGAESPACPMSGKKPEEKEAKKEEKKPEEVPAQEPASVPAPVVPEAPEAKEAMKVDTSVLNASDSIELRSEFITADDLGVLSETEKARLDMLFQ